MILPDMDAGRRAINAIKKSRIPFRRAFWAHFADADEWRLVIVTSLAGTAGSRSVYASIQKTLDRENVQIPLRLIVVVSPNEPIARAGDECSRFVSIGGGAVATTSGSGVVDVTVDPRFVYRDTERAG